MLFKFEYNWTLNYFKNSRFRFIMGRKRHIFRKKKNASNGGTQPVKDTRDRRGYNEIVKVNENFENFYKMQGLVAPEEWDSFMSTLRTNLPVAFRITGYKGQAKTLLNIIKGKYFDDLLKHASDNSNSCRPFCLPWYPNNLAWQMNLSRIIIRTSEELHRLHNFLVSETETGNISRQEAVSMIPPILLNVEPHHKVLDMCAAPGSKTAQVIEFLHKEDGIVPDGLVVANDVDNKRCYMLVHQAKRLNSPCFIITNQDASNMPNLKILVNGNLVNIKYDRILCDVPCSGDGTIRKTPDIWQKWNAANANNLHCLQLKIAKRGLELLAPGGCLVYSTCSLNPIEDEAVISSLLQSSNGDLELLDVNHQLEGLKRTSGISHWKVLSRDLEHFSSFEDVPEKLRKQIRPSMFPPSPDVSENLHLERCFRILPHHQDTGGFFVAVIKKLEEPLASETANHCADDAKSDITRSPPRKKMKLYGYKEDPFIFLESGDEDWPVIKDFYGLTNFDHTQLLGRCKEGRKRNLYFVSQPVKNIIQNNTDHVKIINTGVRMFCRSENKDAKCVYRLTQEGIATILPFMSKRKVNVEKEDLVLLLNNEYTNNDLFSEKVVQQLEAIESGCVILIYTGHSGTEEEFSIEICGWKGKMSLRCYVPKAERAHYLRMCGVDVSDYENRAKKKFKIKAENPMGEETEAAEADDAEAAGTDDASESKEQAVDSVDKNQTVQKTQIS